MRPALEQSFIDHRCGELHAPRENVKPRKTAMDKLRAERPELFLTEEERDAIKEQWGGGANRGDLFDDIGRTRGLCVGAPAPLLTDEGRRQRRLETQRKATARYRKLRRIEREMEQLKREQAHDEKPRATTNQRAPGDAGRPAPTTGRDEAAIPAPDPAP